MVDDTLSDRCLGRGYEFTSRQVIMVDEHRNDGPLHGLRVLDIAADALGMAGRYLADLGADVVRGEVLGLATASPDAGLAALTHHANKRGAVVDLTSISGRRAFRDLVGGADIVLESAAPGELEAVGLGPETLSAINPRLVHVSMTPFGRIGPLRDWVGTNDVIMAIGGVLSRSGLPGRPPL